MQSGSVIIGVCNLGNDEVIRVCVLVLFQDVPNKPTMPFVLHLAIRTGKWHHLRIRVEYKAPTLQTQ